MEILISGLVNDFPCGWLDSFAIGNSFTLKDETVAKLTVEEGLVQVVLKYAIKFLSLHLFNFKCILS